MSAWEPLRPGYKQTQAGVIPEDWDAKAMGDLASLYQPETISAWEMKPVGYPVFGANGLVGFYDRFSHGTWQTTVTCRGSTCGTVNRTVQKSWITGNAMVVNVDTNAKIEKEFFYHLLKAQDFTTCITGTGQPQIVRGPLRDFHLPVPRSKDEQCAIAGALSDVGALIAVLDALIAKKRDIKQAAMQQLVTGKTRLPGFSGEWETKRLGEICRQITDGTHFTPTYVEQGVPFYSVENVTADNFTDTKFVSRCDHEAMIKRCKPEKGDILLTRIGSLGLTKLIDWDVDASIYVSLALLKLSAEIDPTYIHMFTKSDKFVTAIEQRSLMNAAPKKINMGEISDVPVRVPPLNEQRALGALLQDMAFELAALEARREKTRALKQGMMQELLTGRIRLI
jgi:type I restriction enzyme, S subunit